jgi:hypothetical protein
LNYAADRNPSQNTASCDIPSWVTDWTAHSKDVGIRTSLQTRYEEYNAAAGVVWSGSFRGNGSEPYSKCLLIADGVLVDEVCIVGDLSTFEHLKDCYPALRQWRGLLESHFGLKKDLKKPYLNDIRAGTFDNAFWRTLTGNVVVSSNRDRHYWYRPASEENKEDEDFNSWWDAVTDDIPLGLNEGSGSRMGAFLENIKTAISRRRFFITRKGYIGNGPSDTQRGDEIFILCGGKMPLVLRKDPSEIYGYEKGPFHKLVGDAYVHGIMTGKAAAKFEEEKQMIRLK